MSENRVIVIGAGIGGLTVGALLARRGYSISVVEALAYPGGCAATFERQGYRFDAGATVGCGFHKNGPLALLGEELGISWPVMTCPAAWDFIQGDRSIHLSHSRQEILAQFPDSRLFWDEQDRFASLLWSLAGDTLPWPPASLSELGVLFRKLIRKVPSLAPMMPLVNKTALQWLRAHGLDSDSDFVRF
ncbi:MAG: NAD(P)-binding protein, partial [Chlorobium sp.]|nr:NAD(P)-binding protein [Chlorobium sp.]